MPELPEVITIRNDLRKEVLGKKISKVSVKKSYNRPLSSKTIKTHVLGHTVDEVSNVAKLLVLRLSSGKFVVTHLNMSGNLLFNVMDPYVKVSIHFDSNDVLHYSSVRMFGYLDIWGDSELQSFVSRYGKSPIESNMTWEEFKRTLKFKKGSIKKALLDQKAVSGIGNIYANDALYLSGVHPKRAPSSLTDADFKALFENVVLLLNEGIEHRGSTIDRYRDLYGKPGWHQNHFRIYGKENCMNCGSLVSRIKLDGRGTFFCPLCQPETDQCVLIS